jgi:hypothetical protein
METHTEEDTSNMCVYTDVNSVFKQAQVQRKYEEATIMDGLKEVSRSQEQLCPTAWEADT